MKEILAEPSPLNLISKTLWSGTMAKKVEVLVLVLLFKTKAHSDSRITHPKISSHSQMSSEMRTSIRRYVYLK